MNPYLQSLLGILLSGGRIPDAGLPHCRIPMDDEENGEKIQGKGGG